MSVIKAINPLFAKTLVIGLIAIGLLVPLAQVESLVAERGAMRDTAEQRVAQGWGRQQVLGGPVLQIPVDTRAIDPVDARREIVRRDLRFLLPETLDVVAELTPAERHSGIYRVNGYTASLAMTARFKSGALQGAFNVSSESKVAWPEVKLLLPVSDLRGIREITEVSLNGAALQMSPSVDGVLSGIAAPIDLGADTLAASTFVFRGVVAGTKNFAVMPFGGSTAVRIRSSWPHPSFSGAFLPAHYKLDDKGFDAAWQILEVNRDYPQRWDNGGVSGERIAASAFGVSLYDPVDVYQRNFRAIHYAILFIATTFLSLFLWEQIARRRLHAMQYLLIGLALATFYLLLIALSEHMSFALAYALAAAGQIAVLGGYLVGAMRARLAGSIATAGIAAVYGALYLLVLSEQYALLLGALLLFAILAAVLWVTRRLDWYKTAREMPSDPPST
jgi:inner membrane protein